MTDCVNCLKIYSGKCKRCPGYLAEMAERKYKIDNHVHHMAMRVWGLLRGSIPQEINNIAVSSHCKSPLTPMYEETQAGHKLSYPNSFFKSVPACKLVPIVTGAHREDATKCHSQSVSGEIPQGTYFHQDAEYDSSIMDGKHNRTGRRQGSTKANAEEHVGSNPTHPIPVWFHSPRWEHGAGKTFLSEIIPPHSPCADSNHQRMI